MKVPLVDLHASLEPIRAELFDAWNDVLDGMNLFLGPNVQAFEEEFAEYCDVEHGFGVSSGTDALAVGLRALGIGAGDEVIVPSLTFFASIEAIVHVGATPVLVDVEPDTLTIDPAAVTAACTPATRAIMPVHLYGHPADMDPLLEIAREHDLRVIEDCAQAHGARYKGRRCGSMGDVGCFSFYFTKNLGAYGEGGFVCTPHAAVAQELRLLRNHGHVTKFEHGRIGFNLRLDELQAAVLRIKLRTLDADNRRRAAVARRYDALLADLDLTLLKSRPDCEPVHHLYVIRTKERDALREHLNGREIGTGIHYAVPGHEQQALAGLPHRAGPMPCTDQACRTMLSLPMFPALSEGQIEFVAREVHAFASATDAV